jgi:putative phosphotransacetylase
VTNDEIDRLARLVADTLTVPSAAEPPSAHVLGHGQWLPNPVRPEPPARTGDAPAWTGAAQRLDDIAPGPGGAVAPAHRATTGDLTRLTRAAAAGKGEAVRGAPTGRTAYAGRVTSRRGLTIGVKVGISNRHVHLSPEHFTRLFGTSAPTSRRPLTQPGQFAANESVRVEGPAGAIDGIRIVGPARGATQLEIAITDALALGVSPAIAASGDLKDSIGGVTLVGPKGKVSLDRGVIVAGRHLHLSPADATTWGLRDGDRIDVRAGLGVRLTTFHNVLVRSGPSNATDLHLDADEAHAAGVKTGDPATIVAVHGRTAPRRTLVTERDVVRLARAGQRIPAGALLTPSARDRARALGLDES